MVNLPPLQRCQLGNGRQLAWREWGNGSPLIMLHGWSMSSAVFAEVAQILGQYFRVLCPDLPGHGASDPAPDTSLPAFSEILGEWYLTLQLPAAALLGWSLGGQVAMQMVIDKRVRVERLLLVSSTPCFCQTLDWTFALPATQLRALDRNLGRAYEKTMGDFFSLQFAGEDLPRDRYRQILKFAVRSSILPNDELARQVLQVLAQSDLRLLLADIDLPTLVMHGDIDQIIPVAAGMYLAQQISDATFVSLPETGHAPFFSHPETAVAGWLDFLQVTP